jgi:hypothetical protein
METDPEMNALEASLGGLVPARGRFDRDATLFEAGRASVRRGRAGPALAAVFGLIAAGEAVLLAQRPLGPVIERVVVVERPVPIEVAPALPSPSIESRSHRDQPAATAYQRRVGELARYGLDVVPEAPSAVVRSGPAQAVSSGTLLRAELDELLKPGGPS